MIKRHQIVECVVNGVQDAFDISDWRHLHAKHIHLKQKHSFARVVCVKQLMEHLSCSAASTHSYFQMFSDVDCVNKAVCRLNEYLKSVNNFDYMRMAEFCISERIKDLKRQKRGLPIPKRMKFVIFSSKMYQNADTSIS